MMMMEDSIFVQFSFIFLNLLLLHGITRSAKTRHRADIYFVPFSSTRFFSSSPFPPIVAPKNKQIKSNPELFFFLLLLRVEEEREKKTALRAHNDTTHSLFNTMFPFFHEFLLFFLLSIFVCVKCFHDFSPSLAAAPVCASRSNPN
jgi:hypothetical protein